MSKLRGNPKHHKCQDWIGLDPKYGEGGHPCGEEAVIR